MLRRRYLQIHLFVVGYHVAGNAVDQHLEYSRMADPTSLQDQTSVESLVFGEHASDPHLQESSHNDRAFGTDMLEDFDISVQFYVHVLKKALGDFQVFQMIRPIQCSVAMLSFEIDVGSQAQQALDFGHILF